MAADYRTLLGLVREFVEDADRENSDLDYCWACSTKKSLGHEPSCLLERARAAIAPSEAKNDPKLLHKVPVEDRCCSTPMIRAARKGELDNVDTFTCPKCGMEYKAELVDNVKHWTAKPSVLVFKK